MSGLRLAVIYGFPPLRLGFCGPGGNKNLKTLTDYLTADDSLSQKVRAILSRFEAAYPYYQLIARSNQIADPFEKKVVEAYWLGNQFLDKVPLVDLEQLAQVWKKGAEIPKGVVPHHSFHVLLIGSVTGRVKFSTKIRDVCRIGWGQVIRIEGPNLKVKTKPLKARKGEFFLGKEIVRKITWDKRFLPQVKVGETISFHWGRACQVLNEQDLSNLEKYTLFNIRVVNGQRK